jgi:gluconate kinase
MGVAGSGKSTIAAALSRHLGREFRDGDSFHSPNNVAKEGYRDRLRVAGPLLFLYLDLTLSTARQRVAGRHGHFMPASLIDDQFAALERPTRDEPDVLRLDAEAPQPVLEARARSAVIGVRTPPADATRTGPPAAVRSRAEHAQADQSHFIERSRPTLSSPMSCR